MTIRDKVINAFKKLGPSSPSKIAEYTKLDYKQVSGAVTQLTKQGRLQKVSRGTYTYVWSESEKPQPTHMLLNVETGEITREEVPEVEELPVFTDQDDHIEFFNGFIEWISSEHDIPGDVLDEIAFLATYYSKYVYLR